MLLKSFLRQLRKIQEQSKFPSFLNLLLSSNIENHTPLTIEGNSK